MRIVRAILIAFLSVGIAGGSGHVVNARTPTPTRAPTPTPTATPSVPPAEFDVFPWVNADNTGREVTAFIGGTLCATGACGVMTTGPHYTGFHGSHGLLCRLSVPSEQDKPGCGYEGATVTFSIDSQQAPQTAVWHSRSIMPQHITAIIGPPFARFNGVLHTTLAMRSVGLASYVGEQLCNDTSPGDWVGGGPDYSWGTVVFSDEQRPGCAVDGSQVTFKLLDAQGTVLAVANEKGIWHAWSGGPEQELDLTFGSAAVITMPGTGTSHGLQHGGSVWGQLALLLGFVGLASGALGLALRRRAMTR